MKKVIAFLLTVILIMSVTSCSVQGEGAGLMFGRMSLDPEPNSENITHSDPVVAKFLSERVTFLNKVYPHGNITEAEAETVEYLSVFVELETPFQKSDITFENIDGYNLAIEEWRDNIYSYCSDLAADLVSELGLKESYNLISPYLHLSYGSYSEFESTDLIRLAKAESKVFKNLYVRTEYYSRNTENASNHFLGGHSFDPELKKFTPTDEQKVWLKDVIENSAEILGAENSNAAVKSVKLFFSQDSQVTERLPELSTHVFCKTNGHCLSYTRSTLMFEEKGLYPGCESENIYLLTYLPNLMGGITKENYSVDGAKFSDGKLELHLSGTQSSSDVHTGCPVFVIRIDPKSLGSSITEFSFSFTLIPYSLRAYYWFDKDGSDNHEDK